MAHKRMSPLVLLFAALVAVSLLAAVGCGEGAAERDADAAEEPGAGETTEEDAEELLPEGFGYGPIRGGAGGIMLLKDVSLEESGAFERVVIELTTGAGDPPREGVCMYEVSLGEFPYTDEEGNPVVLDGRFFLEITLDSRKADLNLPDAPEVYEGPDAFDPGMALVRGATFVTAYADHTIILLIGLSERAPFRVSELSSPSRIVIDFAAS